MAGELAHFFSGEIATFDVWATPRLLGFIEQTRTQFRLDPDGMREFEALLRSDLRLLRGEYARLFWSDTEIPAPPPPPAGGLVHIRGSQNRPDLPKETEAEGAVATEDPAETGDGDHFRAGQIAPESNYRCDECDAVVTRLESSPLPACECGSGGWLRLP